LSLTVIKTQLPDVLLLEPQVFEDERGYFFESYNEREFAKKTGIEARFVQDNLSCSLKNVLRGLHYQIHQPQAKLVRIIAGKVWDVAVDIRRSSPTFGKWTAHVLSADNRHMLWIPEGFAHGFYVLEGRAECIYKTTAYYDRAGERCLFWNDPDLDIPWPLKGEPILSVRDRQGARFATAEVFP
jgi:dTDP-4-dehydrorhamnose 3,5-epimerase